MCFSFYISMIQAKGREYFQCACDHILVPATNVQEIIWLVLSMELLAISSMSQVRCLLLVFFQTYKWFFEKWKNHLRNCYHWSPPHPHPPLVRKRSPFQLFVFVVWTLPLVTALFREAILKENNFTKTAHWVNLVYRLWCLGQGCLYPLWNLSSRWSRDFRLRRKLLILAYL